MELKIGDQTPTTDFTKALAEELAKQLPVKDIYQDAASPGMREAGKLGSDVVKTILLALAPIQIAAAYQDRLRSFLDMSVRRIDEQRRIPPPAQILGPVLENIRYEPEDTEIDKMFSELLSRSMDSERASEAHPSYPMIIRQLSSDEAKVLRLLKNKQYLYVQRWKIDGPISTLEEVEQDEFPKDGLAFPHKLSSYMARLTQLGLAGIYQSKPSEPIYGLRDMGITQTNGQIGSRQFYEYKLTSIGQEFVKAVIPSDKN
jgi:hypothetical protein